MSVLGAWLAKFTGAMGGAPAAGAIVAGGLVIGIVVGGVSGGGGLGAAPAPSIVVSEIYPCPNMGPPLKSIQSGQHVYVTGKLADETWLRIHYGSAGVTEALDPGQRVQPAGLARHRPRRHLHAGGDRCIRALAGRVDDGPRQLRADRRPDRAADCRANARPDRRADAAPGCDAARHPASNATGDPTGHPRRRQRRRHPPPPPDTTPPTVGRPRSRTRRRSPSCPGAGPRRSRSPLRKPVGVTSVILTLDRRSGHPRSTSRCEAGRAATWVGDVSTLNDGLVPAWTVDVRAHGDRVDKAGNSGDGRPGSLAVIKCCIC